MTRFFGIRDNTFGSRGMPWMQELQVICPGPQCRTCENIRWWYPSGDLVARMENKPARSWPDVMGNGRVLFIASERFVDAMGACGVRVEAGGSVEIEEPLHNGLSLDDAPKYFWIDGARHRAARMDYEASGYVGVSFCEGCGRVQYDVGATYDRQHEDPPPPEVFDYDASSGHDIFTTDQWPRKLFCTDRVLRCAKRHKLTNIRFKPVENGMYGKPIRY